MKPLQGKSGNSDCVLSFKYAATGSGKVVRKSMLQTSGASPVSASVQAVQTAIRKPALRIAIRLTAGRAR